MSKNIRSLEADGGLYLNHWITGSVENRSLLFTPFSALGVQLLPRQDAFCDGQNMENSPQATFARSYGFSRYCSTAFGASDYPIGGWSFKNLSGTLKTIVDCPTKLANFTTSAQTTILSKASTKHGSSVTVADYFYYVDGNDSDAIKWDGTTTSSVGFAAPTVAPTLSFGAGALSPTAGFKYVYCYRSSTSRHISTASPASANTGALTSQNITVSYTASTNPQVDKIWIFRTDDGGGNYFFLVEVANATSSYTDSSADSALNDDEVAPVGHANDPLPSGASLLCWHAGRLWAASGNTLYFAAGPDCTLGNGQEAWPPANAYPVRGAITALASTTNGLLVWTSDTLYVVLGTDANSFTVPQQWQQNFGCQSQNCVAQDGDQVFCYTSMRQLFSIDASGFNEVGQWIGNDLLANFDPTTSSLALHRNGTDQGLWISNGSNRMRRYSLQFNSWDVARVVSGGTGVIFSIEATISNWRLFTGRTSGSGYLLARDTTTYQDDGSSFTCFATVGNLVVAPPGNERVVQGVFLQVKPVGTYPTVGVLMNEISGTFATMPNPVQDPSNNNPSQSVIQKRHFIKSQATFSQIANHMQIKISFPAENFRSEVLGLGIN